MESKIVPETIREILIEEQVYKRCGEVLAHEMVKQMRKSVEANCKAWSAIFELFPDLDRTMQWSVTASIGELIGKPKES